MNILELESVNKYFGKRHIIKNLSFEVAEKSIVAIMGKSGSGKSTILNMIGLLEIVDSATIRINGNKSPRINSKAAMKLRRNMINYLFQSFALISDISVKENLYIAMEFLDLSNKEKDKAIKNILDELGIYGLLNEKISSLSGGEKQRVALARCILKPGKLILADEPTGSLDHDTAIRVMDIIKKLRDDYDKTIIIVTHDIEIAKQCDYIIRI